VFAQECGVVVLKKTRGQMIHNTKFRLYVVV
jgi:hypothetical protein